MEAGKPEHYLEKTVDLKAHSCIKKALHPIDQHEYFASILLCAGYVDHWHIRPRRINRHGLTKANIEIARSKLQPRRVIRRSF